MNLLGEPSSKSVSATESTKNQQLHFGDTLTGSGVIYPFVDAVITSVHLPTFMVYLMILFSGFQCFFTTFWVPYSWNLMSDTRIIYMVNSIINLQALGLSESNMLYNFIAYSAVFAFVIVVLFSSVSFYIAKRQFSKVSLYLTKFALFFVTPISLHPISIIIGQAFNRAVIPGSPTIYMVYVVLLMMYFIVLCVIFGFSFSFLDSSAYLHPPPFSAFRYTPYKILVLESAVFQLLANIFYVFPKYQIYFLIAIHLFVISFLMAKFMQRPFIDLNTLGFYMAITISGYFNDIFRIVLDFIVFESWKCFVYYLCVLIFTYILVSFIVIFQQLSIEKNFKKVIAEIENCEKENQQQQLIQQMKENVRIEAYNELGLDRNEHKALIFFEYALISGSYQVIDFITAKYIVQHYSSTNMTIQCIKFLAYFPCYSSYLNLLTQEIAGRRDLSYFDRFFLYQIQNIKVRRTSSSSAWGSEKLAYLARLTADVQTNISYFWEQPTFATEKLMALSNKIVKLDEYWKEAMDEFSTCSQFFFDYEKFLIECQSNYTDAIKQHYKKDIIESGRYFRVDKCFAAFIRVFPQYIKNGIVNINGRFIVKNEKRNRQSDQSSQDKNYQISSSSSSSSGADLDAIVEQTIGKNMFDQAKLRLTLQRSMIGKKAKYSNALGFTIVFMSLFTLLLILFTYLQYRDCLDSRSETVTRIFHMNQIKFNTLMSTLMLLYSFGTSEGFIEHMEIIDKKQYLTPSWESSVGWLQLSVNYNVLARNYYNIFMNDLISVSNTGENLRTYTAPLFENTTPLAICTSDGNFSMYVKKTIKEIFIYGALSQTTQLYKSNFAEAAHSHSFCSLINSTASLEDPFRAMSISMANSINRIANNTDRNVNIVRGVVPTFYFIVCLTVVLVLYFLFVSELSNFKNYLLNMSPDTKRSAVLPIFKLAKNVVPPSIYDHNKVINNNGGNNNNQNNNNNCNGGNRPNTISSDFSFSSFSLLLPLISYIIIVFVEALFSFFEMTTILEENTSCRNILNWTTDSRARKINLLESAIWAFIRIIGDNPALSDLNYIDKSYSFSLFEKAVNNLNSKETSLLSATNNRPNPTTVSRALETALILPICDEGLTSDNASFHDMYRCSSSGQSVSLYITTIQMQMKSVAQMNGKIKGEFFGQIDHMVGRNLFPLMDMADAAFVEYEASVFDYIHELFDALLVVGIIVGLLGTVVGFWLKWKLDKMHELLIILMRRLNPHAVVTNQDIMEYLLDRNKGHNRGNSEMSVNQRIVHSSNDAILCLDSKGLVEMINPAVSDIFGYTPDQLLGQSILSLLPDGSKALIDSQMTLMRHRQCAMTYEGHIDCITDDETFLRCSITILGITSNTSISNNSSGYNYYNNNNHNNIINNSNNNVKNHFASTNNEMQSFVVILRDESLLQIQQQEAEEAKKSSESLLFQILPRGIVVRLNQGEKDISFSVPSATIMFVDIVKFSEYASTLSPQEIMSNLSLVFGLFDTCIQRYEELLKIKLIGDVYMTAGGLFSNDQQQNIQPAGFSEASANPQIHTEQMARFALEVLTLIDEANLRLNSNLAVRIGINTGGPLIAGVLGSDKPTFDIIGDPINIAARLQSTDIPGRIQISQSVFDLLSQLDFVIEPRGEIMLKGKGKTMTYLMAPFKQLSMTSDLSIGINEKTQS